MSFRKALITFCSLLLSLTVIALILEAVCHLWQIPGYILPPPSSIFASLLETSDIYIEASFQTFLSALIGFALSLVMGGGFALLLSLSSTLRNLFLPVSVFFQTVPVIAVAPLLVIWFGFGDPTVRASAFIVSFFPVLAGTLSGLGSVPDSYRELFLMLKASRLQRLLKLEIPVAIPSFLTGAKVAAGLSVVGAIVGEFIAGGGLGSLIDSARTQQRTEIVFAAIVCSTFLGLLMLGIVETGGLLLRRYRSLSAN